MNKPLPFFYLLLLFLLSPLLSRAQKQGNIWYFGMGAGINFNTSPPSALTDGQMRADEGVATLCNSTGQLLFYTDGTVVWNARQKIMQNGSGLLGGSSSTQAAVIVPHPGERGQFYIFTTSPAHGFRYSQVSMALDEGLGGVVPASKNILLLPKRESTEKLTATRNSNGRDYWVITHAVGNNKYYVFPVTAAGVGKPLIFPIGTVIQR
ncbi:MAG TPA: hypothetical protein VFX43_05160, partial [Chitinophagaceae bacterium]|nr:hypothetical protein [Chitinophagaceae bacterium]